MVGGVETHLDDLCKFFKQQKYTVFIRTYKAFGVRQRGPEVEKKRYINIHRLWWPDFDLIFKLEVYPVLKFFYLFPCLFIDCFLFLARTHKAVDVVQAHGFIAALIAVVLGKIFNKRVVVNTHVGFKLNSGVMNKIIRWTLSNCDRVLVLTMGAKHSLVTLGIPEVKIEVYRYWVDQKIFSIQHNAKTKLGWESKFIVLFVGRLIEVKGVRLIVNLAKYLKGTTFVVIGDGPLRDELKVASKEHSNMLFLGKAENNKLPIYYNASDVLLIPSKIIKQDYEEGIPRVMIEALSCGLPVVSTRSGGIPEILNEQIGRLADDRIDSMKKAIETLYKDRRLLRSISENCRKYAVNLFSVRNARIIKNSLKKESSF